MWMQKETVAKKGSGSVAVAIDRDRSSQHALKWAIENLLERGQTIMLIHVKLKGSASSASSIKSSRIANVSDDASTVAKELDQQTKDLFLPFRCFCTRKEIQCKDIVLEDSDVSKALTEYASQASVENLVIGSGSKSGFLRFKMVDIPGTVIKGAPDFCSVFVISKAKVSNMRSATRQAPSTTTSNRTPTLASTKALPSLTRSEAYPFVPQANNNLRVMNPTMLPEAPSQMNDDLEFFQSPFTRGKAANGRSYGEVSLPDSDISFVSSGRPSIDRLFPSVYDNFDNGSRVSSSNMTDFDDAFDSLSVPRRSTDSSIPRKSTDSSIPRRSTDSSIPRRSTDSSMNPRSSLTSQEGDMRLSCSTPRATDEIEAEMRRLRLELKQTMEMYSNACKEALSAKQMTKELQRWKMEEQKRYAEARNAQEAAMVVVEREKAKSRAAIEAAEAAKKIAELEAQKRRTAEMKALKEAEEKKKALSMLGKADVGNRCRKYSIEEIEAATDFFSASLKIGEGGYGPVYKSTLDHTQVAIKVLRPDAAQGRSQFLQEVEVLSCIRHPNMVLLLGACPEYGCLVYEYMANGSLDDHLCRRGNTPALSWQLRFKIAAEISTGLLFLHQSKPEPLVHRDLKPGNILLDRNFVSKISDVGLARLVPPSVADTETQYRMTSTAGTFCYIDPEYQQTGMLGVKSDIYSLGIIFLQLITGRPPMGLTHHVERAIEQGTFEEMLDPNVTDWPIEEAMRFAELALKCSELRRKDRPDLGKVVLPELNRLRDLAEETMTPIWAGGSTRSSPNHSQVSMHMGLISNLGDS